MTMRTKNRQRKSAERALGADTRRVPEALDGGEVVLYRASSGRIELDVRLERDTVWLTQVQMATLFGRERSVVTKHLNNVFKERELDRKSNVQNVHIPSSGHRARRAYARTGSLERIRRGSGYKA